MILNAKINSADYQRIVTKLNMIRKAATPTAGDSVVIKYVLRTVLDDYVESVVSAMGVVPAEGGSVTPKGLLGSTRSIHWEALAQATVAKKESEGWTAEIWAATGKAADAVKIHTQFTKNQAHLFAGLKSSDGAAYSHAWRTELGQFANGRKIARPLFLIINQMFTENSDKIVREINRLIIQESRWGGR